MHERPLDSSETQLTAEKVFEAGSEFLDHFGVKIDPNKLPLQFLEAMKQFDPRYEGDRTLLRYELEQDQKEWPEETKTVIMNAAEKMRMLDAQTPLVGVFDAVIVLGGARQANLDRARYAAQSIQNEQASFKHLIIAGSDRELKPAEQEATENYAPGAQTEFDLCAAAASVIAQENPGLIASVMRVEGERVGTPDVIETVISSLRDSGELRTADTTIAAITTQIYQSSTELDLARVSKMFGIDTTFTAGNPSDPAIIEKRTTATYMSEIIRTLKAATNAAQAEK